MAGLGFAGWTIPSSIPVSAFGGSSLFSLLNASIADNLAHFPQGPALDDKFWLYLITWHGGLFLVRRGSRATNAFAFCSLVPPFISQTMLLGQIGVQGRKTGYW